MKLHIIDPRKDKRWDGFVESHRYGSIYHSSDWCSILQESFKYKPFTAILEHRGKIVAGIPFMEISSFMTGRRLVSLPRTPYCDPLVDDVKASARLLNGLFELPEFRYNYVELKPYRNIANLDTERLKRHIFYKNHVISLEQNPAALLKSMHKSCVSQRIHKAEKTGLRVFPATEPGQLKLFYELYKKTSKKHMVPARPMKFFRSMWNHLYGQDKLLVLLAEIRGKTVAGQLFLIHKNTIHSEFVGIDYDFIEYSPGHLITWEAIKYAYDRGLGFFDFGLTDYSNRGLAVYKKRWAAEERPLPYFYYPDVMGYRKKVLEPKGNALVDGLWFKQKVRLELNVAKVLYRHFG